MLVRDWVCIGFGVYGCVSEKTSGHTPCVILEINAKTSMILAGGQHCTFLQLPGGVSLSYKTSAGRAGF